MPGRQWGRVVRQPLPQRHVQVVKHPCTCFPLSWLFSGLRSDELSRLRVDCIRWQHNGAPIRGNAQDVLADDAVCLLDVTGGAD